MPQVSQRPTYAVRRWVILGGPYGELSARAQDSIAGPYCERRDGTRYVVNRNDSTDGWLILAHVNIPRRRVPELSDPLAHVQIIRSGYSSLLRTFQPGTF